MTSSKRIVILYLGPRPQDLLMLVRALQAEGTEVTLLECGEPYSAVLDAVAVADSVIVWR